MSIPETCVQNMIQHFKYDTVDNINIRYKLKLFGGSLQNVPTSNSTDIVHNILVHYIYLEWLSVHSWFTDEQYQHALKCRELVNKYLDRYEKDLNRREFAQYIGEYIWKYM